MILHFNSSITDFTSWWLKPRSHSSKKPNLGVLTLYTMTSRKILNFEEIPSTDTLSNFGNQWSLLPSVVSSGVWWGTKMFCYLIFCGPLLVCSVLLFSPSLLFSLAYRSQSSPQEVCMLQIPSVSPDLLPLVVFIEMDNSKAACNIRDSYLCMWWSFSSHRAWSFRMVGLVREWT